MYAIFWDRHRAHFPKKNSKAQEHIQMMQRCAPLFPRSVMVPRFGPLFHTSLDQSLYPIFQVHIRVSKYIIAFPSKLCSQLSRSRVLFSRSVGHALSQSYGSEYVNNLQTEIIRSFESNYRYMVCYVVHTVYTVPLCTRQSQTKTIIFFVESIPPSHHIV